jgi:hypothetical protein
MLSLSDKSRQGKRTAERSPVRACTEPGFIAPGQHEDADYPTKNESRHFSVSAFILQVHDTPCPGMDAEQRVKYTGWLFCHRRRKQYGCLPV